MTLSGKKVWVRDPALADEAVFVKGTVISEDATQASTAIHPSDCTRFARLGCAGRLARLCRAGRFARVGSAGRARRASERLQACACPGL